MTKRLLVYPFALACLIAQAQTDEGDVVVRPRADMSASTPESSHTDEAARDAPRVSASHHLLFQGVPLGGNAFTFAARMKAKGHSVERNDDCKYLAFYGSIAGQKGFGCAVRYDASNRAYKLEASKAYNTYQEALRACDDIMRRLDLAYPDGERETSRAKNEQGETLYHSTINVLSADGAYALGSVQLTLHCPADSGQSFIDIVYVDTYTMRKHEGSPRGLIDLTRLVSDQLDHCLMSINDQSIDFYLTKGDHTGQISAYGMDRNSVLDCVFKTGNSAQALADMRRYLLGLPALSASVTLDTRGCFENPQLFPGGVNPDQQVTRTVPKTQSYQIKDWVMEMIFPKEHIELMKAGGYYNILSNSLPAIFGAVGGNGSTAWDSLDESQKAVIHEHDNAR